MHTDNNEFDNPLKFIKYLIWHVFIQSILSLDELIPIYDSILLDLCI
jgi:hypothetical protein